MASGEAHSGSGKTLFGGLMVDVDSGGVVHILDAEVRIVVAVSGKTAPNGPPFFWSWRPLIMLAVSPGQT